MQQMIIDSLLSAISFCKDNFGWIHLLLCFIATAYCFANTNIARYIPIVYMLVILVAYPIFYYGEMSAKQFYEAAMILEIAIIVGMQLFRHPMARYISIISILCLFTHLLSLLSYYWPLAFEVFGYRLTPLYDISQAHKVIIPFAESFQVVAIFVFSSPRFSHLDKPVQEKELVTWQAMSAHQ